MPKTWRKRPPPAYFTQNIEECIKNLTVIYGRFSPSGIMHFFKKMFYKEKLFISECLVYFPTFMVHTEKHFVNYLLAESHTTGGKAKIFRGKSARPRIPDPPRSRAGRGSLWSGKGSGARVAMTPVHRRSTFHWCVLKDRSKNGFSCGSIMRETSCERISEISHRQSGVATVRHGRNI